MKTVQQISSGLLLTGLAIGSAVMVFNGGLTILGYSIFVPMFLGATGGIACLVQSVWPEKKAKVPSSEKENLKPQAATA